MHTQALPRSVCAIALALVLAGCSTVGPEHRSKNPGQPLLTGTTLFMDGNVEVSARLSSFSLYAPSSGESEGTGGEHRERPKRHTGEHEGEEGPGAGFTIDKGPDVEHVELADDDGKVRPPRWIGSASRQTIVITIHNVGTKPLKVQIEDVTCPIGNFVPIPDTMTLQPGAEQSLEPMRASYPEAIAQLDMTVSLTVGDKHEKQTFRLTEAGAPPAPSH